MIKICFIILFYFLELAIQPSLNSMLVPRGNPDSGSNSQDGARASAPTETSEAQAAPTQAEAAGLA